MATNIVGDGAPADGRRTPIRPTSIGWTGGRGIYYRYEKIDAHALVAAGILRAEELPGERFKCATNGQNYGIHRCRDGSVNAHFMADDVLASDTHFKLFLGALLADTRLSLVKQERYQ